MSKRNQRAKPPHHRVDRGRDQRIRKVFISYRRDDNRCSLTGHMTFLREIGAFELRFGSPARHERPGMSSRPLPRPPSCQRNLVHRGVPPFMNPARRPRNGRSGTPG